MPELSQRAGDTRSEDFRMYLVIRYIAYLGLGVHIICVPLFFVLGVPVLAVFNIFSSVAWFVGYLANRRNNHALAITLLTTEVVAHTIVAVYCVGWHAGFQNYLMAAISFTMFNSALKTKLIVLECIGIGALYCALYALSIRSFRQEVCK